MSYGHASKLLADGCTADPHAELRVATRNLRAWAKLNPPLVSLYEDFLACLRDLDRKAGVGVEHMPDSLEGGQKT